MFGLRMQQPIVKVKINGKQYIGTLEGYEKNDLPYDFQVIDDTLRINVYKDAFIKLSIDEYRRIKNHLEERTKSIFWGNNIFVEISDVFETITSDIKIEEIENLTTEEFTDFESKIINDVYKRWSDSMERNLKSEKRLKNFSFDEYNYVEIRNDLLSKTKSSLKNHFEFNDRIMDLIDNYNMEKLTTTERILELAGRLQFEKNKTVPRKDVAFIFNRLKLEGYKISSEKDVRRILSRYDFSKFNYN